MSEALSSRRHEFAQQALAQPGTELRFSLSVWLIVFTAVVLVRKDKTTLTDLECLQGSFPAFAETVRCPEHFRSRRLLCRAEKLHAPLRGPDLALTHDGVPVHVFGVQHTEPQVRPPPCLHIFTHVS